MDADGIVLAFSGGLDSTTALYEFQDRIRLCVSFHYGSKHNAREIQCAKNIAQKISKEHLIISLPFVDSLFSSDLLVSGGEIPFVEYDEISLKRTVVPFRNGIILSILAGIAESRGIGAVMFANHAGDRMTYPDCRAEFVVAMNKAISLGTDKKVELLAPYTELTKADIAERARSLGYDVSQTWSCYLGGERHCGQCSTCLQRREALTGWDSTLYETGDRA